MVCMEHFLDIITTHDLFCEASFLMIGLLQFIAGDFQVSFIPLHAHNYNSVLLFKNYNSKVIILCAVCKNRSINFPQAEKIRAVQSGA